MRHNITHRITPIIPQNYRDTHEVSVRIPMEKGWIDNVNFYIWKENERQKFKMDYDFDASDETYAYFKAKADLSSCNFNYYFFSFEAESRILYDRHVKGPYQWEAEDKEIWEFYQQVEEFRKSGDLFKHTYRILEISWEHLIFERSCGENEVIIIANRSQHELKIAIPRVYGNAQVVFCTEGSNCEILLPDGAIVLKK